MFVKLVYQQEFPDESRADMGVVIKECDEVYFDAATERLMSITSGDNVEMIDLDAHDSWAMEDETVRQGGPSSKRTIMVYVMNDDGKSVDSFRLK